MPIVISFESDRFDLRGEQPNPINPILGQSVGLWLAPYLHARGAQVSEVCAEDWGWYLDATFEGHGYLLGFVGIPSEEVGAAPEIIVQIEVRRSFWEVLLGKNKLAESDGMVMLVLDLIGALGDARGVDVCLEG